MENNSKRPAYKDFRNGEDRKKSIVVFSIKLLYHLSDLGMLEHLRGVADNWKFPGQRIYHFDPVEEVQNAVNKYLAENKSKR